MILECIQKGNGGSFSINGLGGIRKTFLYHALLAHLRLKNLIAIELQHLSCPSNNAGGRTTHSHFKISIDGNESSKCIMSKQSGATKLLHKAQLLSSDEASMAKRRTIENVDKIERYNGK